MSSTSEKSGSLQRTDSEDLARSYPSDEKKRSMDPETVATADKSRDSKSVIDSDSASDSEENSSEQLEVESHESENPRLPQTKVPLFVGGKIFWLLVGVLLALYTFFVGLDLLGNAFKVLGGVAAGDLFTRVENPIAGLMVGIFSTVLVQSSSTTTSLIVGLVASQAITIKDAVPMIMGANIGTSVTNTLVSMSHIKNKEEYRRAFSGATVHDFFNVLSVAIFLPLELLTGYLRHFATWISSLIFGNDVGTFKSPLKAIVSPLSKAILNVDKDQIKLAAHGNATTGPLVKGGIFYDNVGDEAAGIIVLVLSIIITVLALLALVKLLKMILQGKLEKWTRKVMNMNGYLAMGAGAAMTIAVQSSSITTSTLVPLVAMGIVTLEKMFPFTLGANIGTTATAMLASLVTDEVSAVTIAFVHLLFNISGILVWFPVPLMRSVPIWLARQLGGLTASYRWVPFVYTGVVFFLVPLSLLLLSFASQAAMWAVFVPCLVAICAASVIVILRHKKPDILPQKLRDFGWIDEKLPKRMRKRNEPGDDIEANS